MNQENEFHKLKKPSIWVRLAFALGYRKGIKKALQDGSLENCDCTGLDWSYVREDAKKNSERRYQDAFVKSNLCENCKLSGTNLSGLDLTGIYFYGSDFTGANLAWSNLEGTHLMLTTLVGANLFKARLNHAKIYHAYLEGANLQSASLVGTEFHQTDLKGANLIGVVCDKTNFDCVGWNEETAWDSTILLNPTAFNLYIAPQRQESMVQRMRTILGEKQFAVCLESMGYIPTSAQAAPSPASSSSRT